MPNQNLVSNMQTVFLHNGQKVEETIFLAGFMPFFAKIHIVCIFEHYQSPIDPNFWFYSKIYNRKVCQSKSFLLGTVKKRPEIVVLMASLICKKSMFIFLSCLPILSTWSHECPPWDPYQMKIWTIYYIWGHSLVEHG